MGAPTAPFGTEDKALTRLSATHRIDTFPPTNLGSALCLNQVYGPGVPTLGDQPAHLMLEVKTLSAKGDAELVSLSRRPDPSPAPHP